MSPWFGERIRSAELFVMEADLEELNLDSVRDLAREAIGGALDEHLTAKQWAKLIKLTGLPPRKLRRSRPWFAFVALARRLVLVDGGIGLDAALLELARNSGKRVEFLERVSDQVAALAEAVTPALLGAMLDEVDLEAIESGFFAAEAREGIELVSRAYRAGDLEALIDTLARQQASLGFFDTLGVERTRRWLPAIERYVKRGNVFIAVGAAHVLGEDGILEALRLRGYGVRRVGNTKSGADEAERSTDRSPVSAFRVMGPQEVPPRAAGVADPSTPRIGAGP